MKTHDQFCRCRACKPPLPSDYVPRRHEALWTALAAALAAAAVIYTAVAMSVYP